MDPVLSQPSRVSVPREYSSDRANERVFQEKQGHGKDTKIFAAGDRT